MTRKRFIIEMGMGNDLHGQDYQKAAGRAIESAMRRSTLPIFEVTGLRHEDMEVVVTIGVQAPDRIDAAELAHLLPRGRATVRVVKGGQDMTRRVRRLWWRPQRSRRFLRISHTAGTRADRSDRASPR